LNPNLLATQVRKILEDGAEQVGAGVVYDSGTGMSHELGHGRFNLATSLARVPRIGPAGSPSVGNPAFGIEVKGISGGSARRGAPRASSTPSAAWRRRS
jgi:hypothetical protein